MNGVDVRSSETRVERAANNHNNNNCRSKHTNSSCSVGPQKRLGKCTNNNNNNNNLYCSAQNCGLTVILRGCEIWYVTLPGL
jgi:hypothetical protein